MKRSPDVDTRKAVSRQHEIQYLGHYGYPCYWGGIGLWGESIEPGLLIAGYAGLTPTPRRSEVEVAYARAEAARHQNDDLRLRSCKAVTGYHVQGTDGDIGHVDGLLIDERTWPVRYVIVNTRNWWPGHQVLVAPQWIQVVSWSDATVSFDLNRQAVKGAPPYDTEAPLQRNQEMGIHEHRGSPGYRASEVKRDAAGSELQ